jgi:hypothetical protein
VYGKVIKERAADKGRVYMAGDLSQYDGLDDGSIPACRYPLVPLILILILVLISLLQCEVEIRAKQSFDKFKIRLLKYSSQWVQQRQQQQRVSLQVMDSLVCACIYVCVYVTSTIQSRP